MSLLKYLAKTGTKVASGIKEAKVGEKIAEGASKASKWAEENPRKAIAAGSGAAALAAGGAAAMSGDDDDDEPLEHIMRKAKKKLREYLD